MELTTTMIRERMYCVRGHYVVFDRDLADFYQIQTRALNQAVQRNSERFPSDFAFRLTVEEGEAIKVWASSRTTKHGGGRYSPYAFTEHGVAMLSTVLKNERAIEINIAIMRTFAGVRAPSLSNSSTFVEGPIMTKLLGIEQKYDDQFRQIFQALQQLLEGAQRGLPVSPRFEQGIDSQMDKVFSLVAQHFGLKASVLRRPTRLRGVVWPRQIAIYLVHKHLGCSYREIAKRLAQQDHSATMHAFKKVRQLITTDPTIAQVVSGIEGLLAQG